jgi:hypothetical protein
MSVDVTIGPEFLYGLPRELFQTRISTGGSIISRVLRYDATMDGTRFLINAEPERTK